MNNPILPDDPSRGYPSDHSVPSITPLDSQCTKKVEYKTIIYRPLPESAVREFGQWITEEDWSFMNVNDSPSNQVASFQHLLAQKVDKYFPQKSFKKSNNDLCFMTSQLKTLARRRKREYRNHGKSAKYILLKNKFDSKFEKAASDYLQKNVSEIKKSNPSRAYSILKSLGARENCSIFLVD